MYIYHYRRTFLSILSKILLIIIVLYEIKLKMLKAVK